jgi:hypothetical protein
MQRQRYNSRKPEGAVLKWDKVYLVMLANQRYNGKPFKAKPRNQD